MDESLTDKSTEQETGAEVALPDSQTDTSAETTNTDSVSSGDTQDADQDKTNQPDNNQTTEEDSSSSQDDGLAKFAKSQGFDPDNLTEGESKALKLAHENQKAARTSMQKKSEELNKAVDSVNTPTTEELDELDPTDARMASLEAKHARLEQKQRADDFYTQNPEARDFDKEMAEIVTEEINKYSDKEQGRMAGRFLARDLDRLLVLAKARKGNNSADAAREEGARQERENLRKKQEGSADTASATQSNNSSKKINKQSIADMPDEEYIKLRDSGELQAAINRGELY